MYTANDFARISKTSMYVLPSSVKETIQSVCQKMGTDIVFQHLTQGSSTIQDAIRELNKLTMDNKDILIPSILSILRTVGCSNEFVQVFFQVVKTNSFYQNVYVLLYSMLCNEWKETYTMGLNTILEEIIASIACIECVDSSDYDKYCECNKVNDQRRTLMGFTMKLVQDGVVDKVVQAMMIDMVFHQITEYWHSSRRDLMNELIELLVVLQPSRTDDRMIVLSKCTPETHVGINVKMMFRIQDMVK